MAITIRPFTRSDRDELTALVNLHVAAVIPGIALSVNTVLSQLEREPNETIVDPWVSERHCLVAREGGQLAAAALLHRFRSDPDVSGDYRNAAEIRWLVCAADADGAGRELVSACLAVFDDWNAERRYADCGLPAPACYGVPATLPHLRRLFEQAGFEGPARIEHVLIACCRDLLGHALTDGELVRTMGTFGARLELRRDGVPLGFIEVGELRADLARSATATPWTDVGSLGVVAGADRGEVVPALYTAAAEWLLLGGIERLLAYHADDVDPPGHLDELITLGFVELVRNARGWQLPRRS